MTLLRQAPGQVVARFFAFEADLQNFTDLHPIEVNSSPDEGHRASVRRNVYQLTYGHHSLPPSYLRYASEYPFKTILRNQNYRRKYMILF